MEIRPRLGAPIDAASLAAFRILFGLLMAAAMLRLVSLGWIDALYVEPRFHFTWAIAPWARPLPGRLMYGHVLALAALAIAVAAGWHTRAAAALFFLGFTYLELIDKATYLNHYYLVSLLSALLVVLPTERAWSLDARRHPATAQVPRWCLGLLRFQLAVVFIFAGLAKLDADWLLRAEPMRTWMAARTDLPLLGPLLGEPVTAYVFSWVGAAYDLTIVGLLLWPRTRTAAYVLVVVFHVITWLLFPIGMFPWIMIVATTVFFPPDWPRRWLPARPPEMLSVPAIQPVGVATLMALCLYASVQLLVPLRSYIFRTDPNWTGRGFNFAWRVMIVEKAGDVRFVAIDPATGERWILRARNYITARQEAMMAQDPAMIRLLARHMANELREQGRHRIQIYAEAVVSMNGRPGQLLIDPDVDLAAPSNAEWIVPRAPFLPSRHGSVTSGL